MVDSGNECEGSHHGYNERAVSISLRWHNERSKLRTHREKEKSTRSSGLLLVSNPTSESEYDISASRVPNEDNLVRRHSGTNELSVD